MAYNCNSFNQIMIVVASISFERLDSCSYFFYVCLCQTVRNVVSIHAYMGLSYAGNVSGNLKYYACERGVEHLIFFIEKLPLLLKFNTFKN